MPIAIPPDQLHPATLRRLVEEFVTRDGTDYGRVERSLADKTDDVLRQLRSGEARIVFDAETETTHIVMARDVAP